MAQSSQSGRRKATNACSSRWAAGRLRSISRRRTGAGGGWTGRSTGARCQSRTDRGYHHAVPSASGLALTLEQPCNTVRELAQVRPGCVTRCTWTKALSIWQPWSAPPGRACGGLWAKAHPHGWAGPMAAARDICRAAGLRHTCDDSWGGDIVAAACVQVAASVAPEQLDGSGSPSRISRATMTREWHTRKTGGSGCPAVRSGAAYRPEQFGPPVGSTTGVNTLSGRDGLGRAVAPVRRPFPVPAIRASVSAQI